MPVFFLLLLLFSSVTFLQATDAKDLRTHSVVVSVAPYKFFVEAIAKDSVKINLLVPPGTSFHHYEPTPKQVLEAANADIWFRVGETFETKAISALQGYNPRLRIVDLRDGVQLITVGSEDSPRCCHCEGADLHIWLSPKEAKVQAKLIAKVLEETYPEHSTEYQSRLGQLLKEIDAVDSFITTTLAPLKNRTIMVAHPAYAYFARDYNLKQLPIEYEGKDPTPRQLNEILLKARQSNVRTIFIQRQYSSKGPYLIANNLDAEVVTLDPYSGDYFETLKTIAQRIAEQDRDERTVH